MKLFKLALIGTAALAAASVTARADSLSDLKAQIEALNGRISQLEAAPAVPAGYQLMSISKSDAIVVPSLDIDTAFKQTNVTTIGILPTADVPASTNIQWSGYARAALVWGKSKNSYAYNTLPVPAAVPTSSSTTTTKGIHVPARGQLKVVGTTDTAVGEVGAQLQLRGNYHGHGDAGVIMNEAWGWWKMTPELTLGGGYTGSLSNIGYGYDGACNCYYTDNAPVGLNPGDSTQMRLSYASGPMSFAVALEDASLNRTTSVTGLGPNTTQFSRNTDLGVAAEIKYSGDSFSGEISGGVWNAQGQSRYQIGAGVGFNIGDMAKLSVGAAMGRNGGLAASWLNSIASTGWDLARGKYWKATALASANLSDSVHAEIAYGYSHWSGFQNQNGAGAAWLMGNIGGNTHAALAGIYYDPVSQLTIGLEGEWYRTKLSGSTAAHSYSYQNKGQSVDLVTVFRF